MQGNINWYPGHMKKTRELIAENLRLVGAVIEVCDARIPLSSRNPILGELTGGKPRVLVLNKADLADEAATKDWIAFYGGGDPVRTGKDDPPAFALPANSLTGDGVKRLVSALGRLAASRSGGSPSSRDGDLDRDRAVVRRTAPGRPLRVMIVGVPNSGKSSLINRLARRRAAQTGDRPGVTKGKQWLTLENGMQLLDTPGILWPKFEDPKVGLNLAFCGSIRDEIMDAPDLALELVRTLERLYPGAIAARYGLHEDARGEAGEEGGDDALAVMEAIAVKRGCVLRGGRVDYERAGRVILDEFRSGKLGRVTLERRPEILGTGGENGDV
jgi:ribosome biogenesis GTPase A